MTELTQYIQANIETAPQNESYYGSVLKTISENIFLIDSDCRIIEVLHTKDNWPGAAPVLTDWFSSTALKRIREFINKRWESGAVRYFELQSYKKYFESRLVCHDVDRFVFSFNDITLRKKIENKLADSQFKLQKLNREKDLLLSIIAHDLKNPFNIINGFCSVLLNSGKKYEKQRMEEIIRLISSASIQGFNLLENLLEWSRSQSGSMAYNPEKLKVSDMIKYVTRYYLANIQNKKLNLLIDVPDGICIAADQNMLSTILRNLVSNAIKFSPENGQIVISSKLSGNGEAVISIQDNGVGLSEKQLSTLFQIGKNYSTPGTNGEKGTGLGLLLCKEFVEKQKGRITVKSEKNKGSEFVFTLPVFLEG